MPRGSKLSVGKPARQTSPPHSGVAEDAPVPQRLRYETRVIVFADIVESVRLVQRDELGAAQRIRQLLCDQAGAIAAIHKGRILERRGDGLMLEFRSASNATRFAQSLHHTTARLSEGAAPEDRIRLRIGVHSGKLLTDGVAYYGHGVNVTARLAALAQPAQTIVSSSARELLAPGLRALAEPIGDCYLKHVHDPVSAFRLGPRHEEQSPAPELAPCLAVFPFRSRDIVTPETDTGNLICDAIIAALSRIPSLRVISRLSTARIGARASSNVSGAELGATFLLSGTYALSATALTLTAQLCEARSREVLWTDTLRGSTHDLLNPDGALIGEFVVGVSIAILRRSVRMVRHQPFPTLEGYGILLGGVGLMHRARMSSFLRARAAFEHLADRYPRHCAPHAWLAQWHVFRVTQGWFDDLSGETRLALDHANRALDADSSDAVALTAHGLVNTNLVKDFDAAERSFNLALAENHNEALAWLHRGVLNTFRGRGSQAMSDTNRACSLSPLDPWKYYYDALSAGAALSAENYEDAIAIGRRSLRANPLHASTLRTIAVASSELGRMDEASWCISELLRLDPNLTVSAYRRRSASTGYNTGETWSRALARAGLPL